MALRADPAYGPAREFLAELGQTASPPAPVRAVQYEEPIPGLGRRSLGEGWEEGTCDVVPEYHPPSRSVLATTRFRFPGRSRPLAQKRHGPWSAFFPEAFRI